MSSSPDLKDAVVALVKNLRRVESEMTLLKDERKELIEAAKERMDVKTLKQALQTVKIKNSVSHKQEFDDMVEILETEFDVL